MIIKKSKLTMDYTFEPLDIEKETEPLFPIRTLEDQLKVELLSIAFKKFTIGQLEEKLGGNSHTL